MNSTYIKQNAPALNAKPSFSTIGSQARSSNQIVFDYGHGVPSDATHVHPSVCRQCQLTAPTTVSASGTVDDSVTIVAPGINYTSPSGASHAFSVGAQNVPAGFYAVRVTHYNIQNHPAGNISELKGSLGPCPPVTIVPDKNQVVSCNDCSCGAVSGQTGGTVPQAARAVEDIAVYPFPSSSGGSGVVRTANERHMRFAFSFGSFRGMGNVPGGQPEIVAFDFEPSLLTPASLTYKHPLASVLVPQGEQVAANEIFRIFDGADYANYVVSGDGSGAFGVGASGKRTEVVQFVSAISRESSVVCNLAAASYVRVCAADDSALFYHLSGDKKNEFAAYISPDGAVIEADEKLTIIRDAATDAIRQIWNYWDGLADIVPAADGNGYTISLYLPCHITPPAQEGQLFTFSGNPFKSFTISGDAVAKSMTIRERDWSLPENMPDFVTTWTHSEAGWNKLIGEGDDVISESRVKSVIEGTDNYRIVTTVAKGNEVASCVSEVFTSTANGELLLSRTDAYGSDIAQTTTFEYDEAGRQIRRVEHSGAVYETVYDIYGRVIAESSPWAGGQKRLTTTTYRVAGSSNTDPAKVVHSVVTTSGSVVDMKTDTYTYTEADGVRRVEISSTAAGVSEPQVTIDETWLADAENVYARGRTKMSQAINGVQTHYEYAANATYGALYTVTTETRVNGAAVAGQSRRSVEYIAANGNTMREEEYALLSDGETWALLSGVTNTYDEKNRLVGTLKDNSRSTSRSLNCSGQVLSETDEDGITTIYGYTNSRQLSEMTRCEVSIPAEDGTDSRIIVTPETITSYTYDAMGRTLSIRKDVGAMSTTEYTEYDLLGRVVRTVDLLGRVTTTSYSSDGLTSTVTSPAGATFVTIKNTDGSTARIAGSGQREELYVYDLNGNNERITTKLANDVILGQIITNGFGQTIVQAVPNTLNGFIYTRNEYNAKGQLVKQYQDTGWNTEKTAPTLYEYDSFGNVSKQTLALADSPTKDNSPVVEMAHSVESAEDGVYSVTTQTRYNAEGAALVNTQKQLISQLSATLASKSISIDVRGNISSSWSVYSAPAKVTSFSTIPTSNITAESVSIDGFTVSQKDHAGIITTASRSYTATGITMVNVDGRNNATTVHSDLAGRTISVIDAANAVTTTAYDAALDQPSVITDALGNTSCYKYDHRGRKIAEWGTALQPACFSYDDMNNMTTLRTFRADGEVINTDPSERSDYDETAWTFHAATGLEISKTYADNTSVVKTYDAYNRLATETDARGNVKTHTYEHARGLYLGTSYTVVDGTAATAARSFTYNHLGQMTQLVDDSGTRTFGYNSYGERETDSLVVDGDTHLITETRDSFGRSTGYTYAKNGAVQQTVSTGYGDDGRIASAGFLHGGAAKNFGYTYLAGTNLLQVLTKPNGMTLTQTYEATRDLLTGMAYHRGSTLVAQRTYTYDILGRPTARNTARQGTIVNDTFTHNTRSELVSAQVNGTEYEYAYDNIGNRQQATEGNEVTVYDANALNQYIAISENGAPAFQPQFDADGNQTLIMTETGIWSAMYNAENRPVSFTNADSSTVVECAYDSMGRRAYKKVTTNGSVTLHHRYLYRGYLQIACIDLTRSHHPALWFITWNPSEPIATRPLAIQKDGTWYTYGLDLTKNVCEVFGSAGYIATAYTYSPYGSAAAIGSVTQPIQWSSEVMDSELKMVYYNWRYYNMLNGRWNNKDLILSKNLYLLDNPSKYYDILGLSSTDLGTVDELKKKNCCFIFTIKVDGRNYDYSSAIALRRSMYESPESSVGHTWIRLENVTSGEVIEGGHSGEDEDVPEPGLGKEFSEFETYNGGIDYLRNNKKGPFPNFPEADPKHPFRWLFHEYNDGTWAKGSGDHTKVTGECSWCIDKQKYKQTRDYIHDFIQNKVKKYGLTQNQCTSTAAKIAEQAGINVDPYVTITLPYLVERDSRYRKIKFAAPERMQEVMKTAGSNKNMRVCR
ncbi:MAG: RHS repeat protein [Akkermansia sp.]|nr:RHS repeat protein [Akkermansia sp.]